jgi:hypothetical protein
MTGQGRCGVDMPEPGLADEFEQNMPAQNKPEEQDSPGQPDTPDLGTSALDSPGPDVPVSVRSACTNSGPSSG